MRLPSGGVPPPGLGGLRTIRADACAPFGFTFGESSLRNAARFFGASTSVVGRVILNAPHKFIAIGHALERGAVERTVREDRLGARTPPTDAWRGGCAGGAARDDSIAPHPPRRRKPGDVGGTRPCAGDRDERAGSESATNQVEVRPVSGRKGSGRREDARTPRRQGVKAIWRLPNPRGARRNARPRKSRDRRKPDAPVLDTHMPAQKKVGDLQ